MTHAAVVVLHLAASTMTAEVTATMPVAMILDPSVTVIIDPSVTTVWTTRDACRAVARTPEVSTVPTVVHAVVCTVRATIVVAVAMIVAVGPMMMPGMTAAIGGIEVRTSEIEEVTMGVAEIDAEVPVACVPVEWTIEIAGCHEGVPLPVEQDVAQIQVATLPVDAVNIVAARHSHQVVKVDLVCCLVLLISQIQLIRHLVGQEQGLLASLLIAHCVC